METLSDSRDYSTVDLLDVAALEQLAVSGHLPELLMAQRERATVVVPPRQFEEDARRAVFLALRVDLAQIVAFPEQLFVCLYNRLWWHRSQEAALFDQTYPSVSSDISTYLRDWLERWRLGRSRTSASGVARLSWLRSMRPPAFPLEGSLVEEYLVPDGYERVRLSHDERLIVLESSEDARIAGIESRICLERSTGRRWIPSNENESNESNESNDKQRTSGGAFDVSESTRREERFTIESADGYVRHGDRIATITDRQTSRVVDAIQHPNGLGPASVSSQDGSLYVAYLPDYDEPTVVARFDEPYEQPTWVVEIHDDSRLKLEFLAPDLLVLRSDRALQFIDRQTGDRVALWPLQTRAHWINASGTVLVTLSGSVVRVWDCASKTPVGFYSTEARNGWADALFSPDSKTVLTGKLLCKTETVELIATLPLDGRGYLEGGPPANARQLANDRFVEANPFRGLQVWSTQDGTLERQSKGHELMRFSHSSIHRLDFSPDARFFVATVREYRAPHRFTLCAVDAEPDQRQVAVLLEGDPAFVRFSPSSQLVMLGTEKGRVMIWTLPDTRMFMQFDAHDEALCDAIFSDREHLLITAAVNGNVRLWDVRTAQKLDEKMVSSDDDKRPNLDIDTWVAGNTSRAHVEGWHGFTSHPHAFSCRIVDGYVCIVDLASDAIVARVGGAEGLVSDPTGKFWAYRTEQYVLEL